VLNRVVGRGELLLEGAGGLGDRASETLVPDLRRTGASGRALSRVVDRHFAGPPGGVDAGTDEPLRTADRSAGPAPAGYQRPQGAGEGARWAAARAPRKPPRRSRILPRGLP
jgi:hypothetical protein